jgi:hypothetical protein
VGDIQATNSVSDTVTQLKQRLTISPGQRYDFVLENDLAGRAALSILWSNRDQLNIYLVAEDPQDRNVAALRSGLTTVRTPPEVEMISPAAAEELAASDRPLIWAVTAERTPVEVQQILQHRAPHTTYVPYAQPLDSLSGRHPDQTEPSHELILRDIIHRHARFLNFYGDRCNPRDLYERTKYPRWFTAPQEFTAAIPPITQVTAAADGTITQREEFTGLLQLAPDEVRTNHCVTVDLTPILSSIEEPSFDLTLHLQNDYMNPQAAGALAIEVHDASGLLRRFDIATSPTSLDLPLSAVRPANALSVSVVSLKDNPRNSWSVASRTSVTLTIHPPGTHPTPRLVTRAKSWLHRRIQSRHRRT